MPKQNQSSDQVFLLRRLQAIENVKNGTKYKNSEYENSLTQRYLKNYANLFEDEIVELDVDVIGHAIENHYTYGQAKAFEYIDYFTDLDVDVRAVCKSIVSALDVLPPTKFLTKMNALDASIFANNLEFKFNEQQEICLSKKIENLLGEKLPFDRSSMSSLFDILIPHLADQIPQDLEELRTYILEFVSLLWPIFTPKILKLAYIYLDYHSDISEEQMLLDYSLFKRSGFQKICSRLIVLKAVNYGASARAFLNGSNIWADTGLSETQIRMIQSFLADDVAPKVILSETLKYPPLEKAIFLSLYVYGRKHKFNLIDRILETFEIDSEVAMGLHWDKLYLEFQEIQHTNSPKMIALAAIMNNEKIRERFEFVKNQYGKGGGNTDLVSYCEYCLQQKFSLFQFLSSFNTLEEKAHKKAIRFLLNSIDEISNKYSCLLYTSDAADE